MFVTVAINTPADGVFTYARPADADTLIGRRVMVPFGKRTLKGIVVSESESDGGIRGIKDIISVIDREPICTEQAFTMARWMSSYYHCSFGEAIFASLPAGEGAKRIRLTEDEHRTPEAPLTLTGEQEAAFESIREAVTACEAKAFLLYGITGSGKTEVYLRAIDESIRMGRQAIVVIPEISLTPQTIERFTRRFDTPIAVLHSRLAKTEKYAYWQRIRKGEISIVIGARSAIFSPLARPGIIIIDEEHETSYKSSESPRFHTRQIAFYRMKNESMTVLFGSATPSIETYHHALRGEGLSLLTLTHRPEGVTLPSVRVVDMRTAKKAELFPAMSEALVEAVNNTIDAGRQAILFLNRKGYSPTVVCASCGTAERCPHCSVTLTYHKHKRVLLCHYCGYTKTFADRCAECGASPVKLAGTGTEKVHEEIALLFPKARIGRMDQESTKERGAYERILGDFASGKTNVLVGTQMIAKGLHFPDVTLVGVLSADTGLNFPDFRASERTFSLITQVSGRSGRGITPGEVVVQTYNPDNSAIRFAREHDYLAFYRSEIELREALNYPPFSRLVRLVVRGVNESAVAADAERIRAMCAERSAERSVDVLGPAPCPLAKLKKYYRHHVILKARTQKAVSSLIVHIRDSFRAKKDNFLEIDVDPASML